MLNFWSRFIATPKGEMIRDHDTRVRLVGVIKALDLDIVFFRVGTLYVSHFSIWVSLIDLFKSHFRLSMKASPTVVIILTRVMVSL